MLTRFPVVFLALSVTFGTAIVDAPSEPAKAGLVAMRLKLSDGKSLELKAPKGGVLVLVYTSTECPISNEYSPTLNELARGFPSEKFTMIGVCLDPDKTDAELSSHAKEFSLVYPLAGDPKGKLAAKLGIKVTPEAVVIDEKDRIRYQGRIDDKYPERGKHKAIVESHDLRDAVSALLEGREVKTPRTKAVGCPIPTPAKE